jgi:hypothetical protein
MMLSKGSALRKPPTPPRTIPQVRAARALIRVGTPADIPADILAAIRGAIREDIHRTVGIRIRMRYLAGAGKILPGILKCSRCFVPRN